MRQYTSDLFAAAWRITQTADWIAAPGHRLCPPARSGERPTLTPARMVFVRERRSSLLSREMPGDWVGDLIKGACSQLHRDDRGAQDPLSDACQMKHASAEAAIRPLTRPVARSRSHLHQHDLRAGKGDDASQRVGKEIEDQGLFLRTAQPVVTSDK